MSRLVSETGREPHASTELDLVGFHRSPERIAAADDWRRFLERNAKVIAAAGLPPAATASPLDWDDVLMHGHLTRHPDGFSLDQLTPAQYAALVELAANYFAVGYEFYLPSALRVEDQAALRARFEGGR
jgi:hypothetical protein